MTAILEATKDLEQKGYLDLDLDPTIDFVEEIQRLKKKKMRLFWRIITKSLKFRMLQIILAIAWACHKKRRAPMPI